MVYQFLDATSGTIPIFDVIYAGNQRGEHEAMETALGCTVIQSIGASVSAWIRNSQRESARNKSRATLQVFTTRLPCCSWVRVPAESYQRL